MARVSPIVTNFTAGELGRRMDARVDVDRYGNGAELLVNGMVRPTGGFSKVSGTRLVGFAKSNAQICRLLEFEYKDRQPYVLEAGDFYVRFWRLRSRVEAPVQAATIANGDFPSGIGSWTTANTGTGATSHDAPNGRATLAAPATGDVAELRQQISNATAGVLCVIRFQVAGGYGSGLKVMVGTSAGGAQLMAAQTRRPGWHTIQFTPSSATFHLSFRNDLALTSVQLDNVEVLSGVPVELPSPWPLEVIGSTAIDPLTGTRTTTRLQVARYNDVAFCCAGGDTPVYELGRYGDAAWGLSVVDFADGPYLEENPEEDLTLTPSSRTVGAITLTASRALWVAGDVGRHVRFKQAGLWMWGYITGYTSETVVAARLMYAALDGSADATPAWQLGAWGGARGWPQACGFFKQRLFLGGTESQPQTVWGSRSGAFRVMSPSRRQQQDTDGDGDVNGSLDQIETVTESDAVAYTIAAEKPCPIYWLVGVKSLLVGTPGGVFKLDGGRVDQSLTPVNVDAQLAIEDGCARARAIRTERDVVYPSRSGRYLRKAGYELAQDGWDGDDLTLLHDRVMGSQAAGGIIDMAWQSAPFPAIWSATAAGELVSTTYAGKQRVLAHTRHPFALDGVAGEGVGGAVEAVATIHNGRQNEVWLVVRRTLGGTVQRCIEIIDDEFDGEDIDAVPFFVRCGLSLNQWNQDAIRTLTLSGGTTWAAGDSATLTASGFTPFDGPDVAAGRRWRLRLRGVRPDDHADAGRAYDETVEVTTTGFTSSSVITVALVTDCAASLRGVALTSHAALVTTLTNLSHLEGHTVSIMVDNAVHAPKVVVGGAVALDAPGAIAVAGLRYRYRGRTLDLEAGAQDGTSQGKRARIHACTVRLFESGPGRVGRPGKLEAVNHRPTATPMGQAALFRTGDVDVDFPADWKDEKRIEFDSDAPLPFTVAAIMPQLTVNDRVSGGRNP